MINFVIEDAIQFCNNYNHSRTGLMLSGGAVESLPEFYGGYIVMKLLEINLFCLLICPNFHGFPKIIFWGGAVAPCLVHL